MEERLRLLARWLDGEPMAGLHREFQISRTAGTDRLPFLTDG